MEEKTHTHNCGKSTSAGLSRKTHLLFLPLCFPPLHFCQPILMRLAAPIQTRLHASHLLEELPFLAHLGTIPRGRIDIRRQRDDPFKPAKMYRLVGGAQPLQKNRLAFAPPPSSSRPRIRTRRRAVRVFGQTLRTRAAVVQHGLPRPSSGGAFLVRARVFRRTGTGIGSSAMADHVDALVAVPTLGRAVVGHLDVRFRCADQRVGVNAREAQRVADHGRLDDVIQWTGRLKTRRVVDFDQMRHELVVKHDVKPEQLKAPKPVIFGRK